MTKLFAVLCLVLLLQRAVESAQEETETFSTDFTKALDVCKTEMDLPDNINTDILNLWKVGYEVSSPLTGCAVLCLSNKLNLVGSDGSLNHQNIQEYLMKHGADGMVARQLADLLQQCETAAPANDDACFKVLGMAKCFSAEIHDRDWAPDMELIMKDVMAKV